MLNLTDKNISYLLSSSNDINGLFSYLHSRNYNLVELKGYYNEEFEDSVIAYTDLEADELRIDALHIMENFDQDCLLIKYKGDSGVKKIFSDGQEKPMGILLYNTDAKNKSYIYDGLSFSFVEKQLYFFPKRRSDFKKGMIVEYFNRDKWMKKQVINPEKEYSKMYSLLMKYNKVRIPV